MSFLSLIKTLSTPLNWLLGSQASSQEPPAPTSGPFVPTYRDVCRARALLKSLQLPTELVLQVLENAQYWPVHEFEARIPRPIVAAASGAQPAAALLCFEAELFDSPVIEDVRRSGEPCKIRSVEFEIASRDQGWTSENSHGSFSTSSWTEVSILRRVSGGSLQDPLSSVMHRSISSPRDLQAAMADCGSSLVKRPESALQGPQDGEGHLAWYLQGNRVAGGKEEYHITWTEAGSQGNSGAGTGEGFVQELKDGDRMLIWARAKVSQVLRRHVAL